MDLGICFLNSPHSVTICDPRNHVFLLHLPLFSPRQFVHLSVCQTSNLQNHNTLCYWHSCFYTKSDGLKFAYVTNLVSPETRQVSYKLHLQEWPCFLLSTPCTQDKFALALNSEVSHFSLYHPPISWLQRWQTGGGCFRRVFLYKDREGGSALASSLAELSDSTSLSSCSRLSALLLEDVPSESSSDVVTLWRGHRSFTWLGILSTRKDCVLIILVAWPQLNFVVHRLSSALTYMQSPTW